MLRRAEVCLCHQLLDHPHKTFSVSSTASQSSGRSSWPTKRPSLPLVGGLRWGAGPPTLVAWDTNIQLGWVHQSINGLLESMMYIHLYARSSSMLDMNRSNRIQQDPTGSKTQRGFPWFSLGNGWHHGPVARLKAMLNLLDEELDKVKRSPGGWCGTISRWICEIFGDLSIKL